MKGEMVLCSCLVIMASSVAAWAGGPAGADFGATEADYQWWREARFGIFIHWGVGACIHRHGFGRQDPPPGHPPYRETSYNAKGLPVPPEIFNGEYLKYAEKGGKVPVAIYDNLYRVFNPTKFDADEWARTFKAAGARYVIFTTKHHDGFCMFDSKLTDYDIMSTPFKRDVCKELADACHRHGLKLLWYYSVLDMYDERYDVKNPKPYEDYLCGQMRELLTNYGPIAGIWWDGGVIRLDTARICRLIRTLQPGCIYNGRCWGGRHGLSFGTPEQRIGNFNMSRPWETCAVIHDSSWFWNGGKNIKSLDICLRMLIDSAGGDGNLALDFGPCPDGSIYPPIKERFLEMGRWLEKYGESIYGTRGGPYKPGLWGVSTRRGNTVYLHITQKWPGGVLALPPLPAKVTGYRALTGGKPTVEQAADRLVVRLDPKHHASPDTIIALTLDRDAMSIAPIETLFERTLTTDARVTASSSVNPKRARGAPETVVPYSFESGKVARQFGEESEEATARMPTGESAGVALDVERIKKIIGRNHRGHFWRYWMPRPDDPQPWLEVDIGKPRRIRRVGITELYGQARAYKLQYHDGTAWKTFYEGRNLGYLQLQLPQPITARRVRLLITATSGAPPSITIFDLF